MNEYLLETIETDVIAEPFANVIEVFVCRGFSGQITRLNAEADAALRLLVPIMAEALGMGWQTERLGLYNLTRDIEYESGDSLAGRGTMSGDLLLLADGGGCHKTD